MEPLNPKKINIKLPEIITDEDIGMLNELVGKSMMKCEHCNTGTLELIIDTKVPSDPQIYLICNKCDSTYNL